MLKRICLAFALFVLGTSPLLAQSSVLPYFYTTGNTKVAVGNSNPLPVTISGGGGGGLSVQDQASWTQGSSNMTPVGCAYNDTATLTSGQQGTVRCNTKRAAIVDVDTSGNNLYAAMTSSIPAGTNLIGDVNVRQGGSALSTSNGIYSNCLLANTACGTGTGASGSATQRVTPANDTAAGVTPVKSSVPVVNGGSNYQHVAASATNTVLGATGATGDYLSHCVIYPATTGAGSVTVFDNTNSAANIVIEFTSGTLSNLAPIPIPVGAISTGGAWKITTGTNVTVSCFGKFT